MDEQEFIIKQQEAIKRMKETAQRTRNNGNAPPAPDFIKLNSPKNSTEKKPSEETKNSNSLNFFDIPFLSRFKEDKDFTLILGLILVLLSEKSDKLLLFALLYILL